MFSELFIATVTTEPTRGVGYVCSGRVCFSEVIKLCAVGFSNPFQTVLALDEIHFHLARCCGFVVVFVAVRVASVVELL